MQGGVTAVVVLKVGRTDRAFAEFKVVEDARGMQAQHILHDMREVIVRLEGSVQRMPKVEILSSVAKHSQVALQYLKQLPSLLQELWELKILFVDVKTSNFGVFLGRLVAVDCDSMIRYSDPEHIPGPFACTPGHGAVEVLRGDPFVTLRSDVQAFAFLIADMADVSRLSADLQALLRRSMDAEPQNRPSMPEFITGLRALL